MFAIKFIEICIFNCHLPVLSMRLIKQDIVHIRVCHNKNVNEICHKRLIRKQYFVSESLNYKLLYIYCTYIVNTLKAMYKLL